jgi:hypothetical protein
MSKRSEKKDVKRSLRLVRNWPRSTWNPRKAAVVIPAQRTPEKVSVTA